MYLKIYGPEHMLPPGIEPLCNAYHSVYLNQGVADPVGSGRHLDGKDDVNVFNAVAPCRDFEGDDMLLWGLKLRVQLCCDDVIRFYGLVLYHNIFAVEGVRSSVNLFCHWTTICWGKLVVKGKTRFERRAERVRYGQKWDKVDKQGN